MTPARISAFSTLLIILLIAVFSLFFTCRDAPLIEKEKFLMGTIVEIKVPFLSGGNSKNIYGSIDKAFDEISRVEEAFSVYKSGSEISKINRLKKDEPLKTSDEVFRLIEESVKYSEMTNGAFDITVKPLIDIWVRAKSDGKIPTEGDIQKALARVGAKDIVLDKAAGTVSFKKEGMAIDLGGVAKGYAVDRAIKILKENGVYNAIIHAGGDMYCLGSRSNGKAWVVGIQHPREREKIFLKLKLKDKAVDTSGDYERYFILNGKRYSHIIDPRTGYPTGDGVVSASVITNNAKAGDMLSTALCVLGRSGLKLVDTGIGQDAVIVIKEGDNFNIEMTKGFKDRYDVKEKGKL